MATLRCARCAASLPWDSRFCLKCGAEITPPAEAAAPAPVVVSSALDQALQAELGGEIALRQTIAGGPLTMTYLGLESRLGRVVRVHVVPPEVARADPMKTQRLLRAARAVAKMRHPRIAPVLRVAAGDRLCWYVTLPEMPTLATLLAKAPKQPLARTLEIVGQAAAALACAHEHGAVHGALSPAAILIDAEGAASVQNLGIADPGELVALRYRAPELDEEAFQGGSAVSDQYALAAIAFEMLAGVPPFPGTSADELRREHRTAAVPPLALVSPEIPPAIATVIERALAKRPVDRYPNIVKFAQAFRNAALGRTSGGAKPALAAAAATSPAPMRQPSGKILIPVAAPDASPIDVPAGPAQARVRKPLVLSMLGAATLLSVLGLIAWQSRSGPISPAEQQRLEARSRVFEHAYADEAIVPAAPLPPAGSLSAAAAGSTSAGTGSPAAAPAGSSSVRPAAPPESSRQPARREVPHHPAEVPRDIAPSAVGYITIGTNPQAAIFIDEQLVPSNPIRNWPVRAGAVFLRFEVMDTVAGVWTQDMTVNIEAGDTLNLRRIRLVHP
ncbi:MAG TPA: protein kinase [Gemmatimonadales bacterium]